MYVITVDALSIQYIGDKTELKELLKVGRNDIKDIGDGFSLRNSHRKNASFSRTSDILIDGETLGQVYHSFNSKWRYSNPNVILFTVENHILYQLDWSALLRRMQIILKIQFLKYDSMEIAIDGIGLVARQNKYMRSLKYNRSITIRENSDWNNKLKVDKGNVLGSRRSDKYITLYDKITETHAKGKKFIREWWVQAGLDSEQPIERCELRLNAKELGGLSSRIERLEEPNYLAQIFKEKARKYLEFYLIKNTKRRVSVIDWSYFDIVRENKKLKKTQKAVPTMRYKNTIRCLFEQYSLNFKISYLYTLADLSISMELGDWVKNRVPRWIRENRLK